MKRRKGSLLQRMMAVLLSAVLVAGMVWDAAPASVLAQENAGSPEEDEPRGGGEEAGVIEEGMGSGDESRDFESGGSESDGSQAESSESESEGGETEGGEQEGESRESGSVSGNDAEMMQLAALEEDMIMTAADDGTATPGNITSNQTWDTQTLAAGTYTISSGVTVTVSGKLTIAGNVTINGGGTLRWSSAGGDNALEVEEGAQLTLENVTLDGNNIWFSYSALLLGGNVAFKNGTVIQNFKTRGDRGSSAGYKGVIAVYEKGVLNINDGVTITGNQCDSGIIALYQFDNGYSQADSTATVNMYGGTITGNIVKSTVSDMGVIWNWCGNLNISGGTVTAEGGEYAVHTQGNNKTYNATTVISGGIFTGMKNGAVCAGKDSGNRSVIKITGGCFKGDIAATVNYGTIEISGGVYNGTEYALSSDGSGALEVYGGEFAGDTKAYSGTINTNTEKVIVGESKDTTANWDRSTSLNTYKYVAIGELEQPLPSHKHDGVTFTAWTKTDSLPTDAGNYYLTEDVTLNATGGLWIPAWSPADGTKLCLNGHTVKTVSQRDVIGVEQSITFSMYDCRGNGMITQAGATDESLTHGCGICNNGTVHMYGGRICGNAQKIGAGVYNDQTGTFYLHDGEISNNKASYSHGGAYNNGVFYMYGGRITGNQAKFGGGLNNYSSNAKMYLYGGEIIGNHATSLYGGLQYSDGTMKIGGALIVKDNTAGSNNSTSNLCLWSNIIELDSERPLESGAYVGITAAAGTPTRDSNKNITGHNKDDYSSYFHSDNSAYVIVNNYDVVQLALPEYDVTVNGGTVSGGTGNASYKAGVTVTITANAPESGKQFDKWVVNSGTVTLASATNSTTTFTMPAEAVEVTAVYQDTDTTPPVIKAGDEVIPTEGTTEYEVDSLLKITVTDDNLASVKYNWTDVRVNGGSSMFSLSAGTYTIVATDKTGNKTTVRIIVREHDYDNSTWGYREADGHARKCKNCDKHNTVIAHTPGPAATETTPQTCTVCGYEIAPATGGGSSGGNDNNGGNGSGNNSGGDNNSGNNNGNSQTAYNPDTAPVRVTSENQGNIVKEVTIKAEDTFNAAIAQAVSELADIVLTQEEKELADVGANIKIVLDIEDAQNTVSAADKAVVESALNTDAAQGFTVGQYLDVNLFKIINDNRSAIRETNEKILVTIAVPERLKNTDANRTRAFAVVRVHNGVAEVLSDLDDSADTVTIATDRFSIYAIVYNDTADGVDNQADKGVANSQKDNEPKTGDQTHVELYATLSMIAGLTYVLMYFADRERGMSEEKKKELVSRLVGWAKQGGKIRRGLALAAIFVLLVYYHSIGKKTCAEWKEIYGE